MLRRYSGMWFRKLWNVDGENFVSFSRLIRRYASVSSRSVIDMAVRDGEMRVFLVFGEVSGGHDCLSSHGISVCFSGVGGLMMTNQGLKSLFPMEDIAVMGLLELLLRLNMIRVKLQETIEAALLFQPHVVLTVDSKGFSFRLLKQLRGNVDHLLSVIIRLVIHMVLDFGDMPFAARYNRQRLNAPVHFHYVAPSFWAWKGGEARLRGLVQFVDHVLCILSNEEVCRSNGLATTSVGHPSLEDVWELNSKETSPHEWKMEGNCEDFRRKYAMPAGAKVISLLPGSRLQEITRMLSIFTNAMALLQVSFPELVSVVHVAPNQHVKNYVTGISNKWPVPAILIPGGSLHQKYDAFSASSVALCASGPIALEMQLARLPCVVAYSHFLTELIIRYEAKVPIVSLPNVLMGSPIMPEALFQACALTNLASLMLDLVHDNGLREKQIVAAEKVYQTSLCSGQKFRSVARGASRREVSP